MLNVYKVIDGSEWLWVAAESAEAAVTLVRDEYGDDVSKEATAEACSEDELRRVRVDRSTGCDFWTLGGDLARLAGPCVMAGSMY